MCRSQKCKKDSQIVSLFFPLSGTAHAKAALRTLMKLIPAYKGCHFEDSFGTNYNNIKIASEQWLLQTKGTIFCSKGCPTYFQNETSNFNCDDFKARAMVFVRTVFCGVNSPSHTLTNQDLDKYGVKIRVSENVLKYVMLIILCFRNWNLKVLYIELYPDHDLSWSAKTFKLMLSYFLGI